MENFDLEQFERRLIAAVDSGGHNMDMLLVMSELVKEDDVKGLFSNPTATDGIYAQTNDLMCFL